MKKMLLALMVGISIAAASLAGEGGSMGGTGRFVCTQYDMNALMSSLSVAKNCVTNSDWWRVAPVTKTYDSIAFTDNGSTTYAFPCVKWPGSSAFNDGKDGFVVLSTAKIVISETGDWTFACYSDDGFELKLSNGGNEYTMSFEENRAADYTLKTFNLTAGIYDLNLTYFEHTYDAICILSAAKGSYSSFNSTAFKLVGDAANGIALADTHAIVFDANGGTVMPSAVVREHGSVYGTLPTATRVGCAFDGWYTEPDGGERITSETVVDGDMTLYAHWSEASITISDVKVFSGYPWQEVAIGYTITADGQIPFGIGLTATDLKTGKTYEATTLTGARATPGRHVMYWNASADGAKFKSDQVVFTVTLKDTLYCVIDLSGGVNAESYPVSYRSTVPEGGWTDEYKTTKLVLRRIEAGSFIMGDDQANEAHRVTLTRPFYMGVFEVTQKQWSLVMGTTPWSSTTFGKGDSYPAHYISYNMIRGAAKGSLWPISPEVDPESFMGKLQAKTGLDFDLPTEAQWEYACRAGSTTIYYWGDSMHGDFAWYSSNSNGKAHPVGTKVPNAWGLYDMSGNMWERLRDWSGSLAYGVDPQGAWVDFGRGDRGGSFGNRADCLESSARHGLSPEVPDDDFGFRISRTLAVNCTVTFNATGGTVGMTSRVVKCGTPLTALETPARDGFEFLGWYTAETGGTRFDESTVVSGDLTLYARWTPMAEIEQYCVVDLSGGSSATSYPVSYMNAIPEGGWTDEYKTTKLVLRRLNAGAFIMGNNQMDETHRVTLTKPFYMGVFEVTQKQWSLVMGSNPCSSTSYGKGDNYPVHYVSYDMIRGASAGSKWPASADVDASSFLGKLKAKTGLDFDLPTEAQWEYACRAGTFTTYYWGNVMNGDYAWYGSNSGGKTNPVGMKQPNIWGLYDMTGNVWEWNRDWYNSTLSYGTDPKGSSSGGCRVLRGDCRRGDASGCASSHRDMGNSADVGYSGDWGFRLVRALSK